MYFVMIPQGIYSLIISYLIWETLLDYKITRYENGKFIAKMHMLY